MGALILVEDNTLIREAVAGYLKLEGYTPLEFAGVGGVMDVIKRGAADLAILDIMLPDGNGFSLAKKIRAVSQIPLIFLTAKDSESDRILGFEFGADDYITKPFSARELVLRVNAILRRAGNLQGVREEEISVWKCGKAFAKVDVSHHEIRVNEKQVSLTVAEWKILLHLVKNHGRVVTREQILSECLNYFFEGSERTIDTHIANLRSKLGSGWIATVRGFGYKFCGEKK